MLHAEIITDTELAILGRCHIGGEPKPHADITDSASGKQTAGGPQEQKGTLSATAATGSASISAVGNEW